MRIGQGFDVHELVADRPCIIGGVTIPFEKGLLGITDADVLVHSIIDGLLGTAAQGDIGAVFPADADHVIGANSLDLLAEVCQIIRAAGYEIGNIDTTILAEQPKMASFIPKMKENICTICQLAPEKINIKATTMEKMGFIGRMEAIGATSVVLLKEKLEKRG